MDFHQAIRITGRQYGYVPDMDALSVGVREFLDSESITNLILQIGLKYGLVSSAQYDVAVLTVWYVAKMISEQEFINLLSLAPIQQKYFDAFRQELQDKVWEPYDSTLLEAKIPYKLLTKINPEPHEKIQAYLADIEREYPEESRDDLDTVLNGEKIQEQKDFSLGDQIKVLASRSQPQQKEPTTQEPVKIVIPDTSFVPKQEQAVQPIEITVTPVLEQKPVVAQQTKPIQEQPASQVRIEIGRSQTEIPETKIPVTQPQNPVTQIKTEPVLPSMRFAPLLSQQQGALAKQVTPSIMLQETLGRNAPETQTDTQQVPPISAQPVQSTPVPQQPQQKPTHDIIDLSSWNIKQ